MSKRRQLNTVEAAGVDLLMVVAFAVIGRLSHGEDAAPAGVFSTGWPFVGGLVLGWILVVSGLLRGAKISSTLTPLTSGVVVWACTLGFGMVIRHSLAGQGVQTSFVIAAGIFLAIFLLGWRALVARL